MIYEQLLKKVKEQAKYWANLVHYTKPEFYENTIDQRNAWKALRSLLELHQHKEDPDYGWLCAVCDQGPGPYLGIQQYLDNRQIYGYLTLRENVDACKEWMARIK